MPLDSTMPTAGAPWGKKEKMVLFPSVTISEVDQSVELLLTLQDELNNGVERQVDIFSPAFFKKTELLHEIPSSMRVDEKVPM